MQEMVGPRGDVMTVVHFMCDIVTPPLDHEGPPIPQLRVACMPNMVEFGLTAYHPVVHRTDDPRAANCPHCKRTEHYKRAVERLNAATAK